jgi:hypothetical protein
MISRYTDLTTPRNQGVTIDLTIRRPNFGEPASKLFDHSPVGVQ